jgi:hypothetical protein
VRNNHHNLYLGHAKGYTLFLLVRTCRDKVTKQSTFIIMPFHIVRRQNTSSHMWGRNWSQHKVRGTCAFPCGIALSYCPRRNERGHSYLFSLAGLSLSPPTATCRGHPYLLHTCGTARYDYATTTINRKTESVLLLTARCSWHLHTTHQYSCWCQSARITNLSQ